MLLFPTEYGEGYPGIITECKIAGIPVVASEFTYSREIIANNKDGIILRENTVDELIKSITFLNNNREKLNKLRYLSYLSGENCFIESYIEKIIKNLTD